MARKEHELGIAWAACDEGITVLKWGVDGDFFDILKSLHLVETRTTDNADLVRHVKLPSVRLEGRNPVAVSRGMSNVVAGASSTGC